MLVRLVFLLGRPPSEETKRQVEAESGKFDDLVVGDFIDSYVNLTLKVLHGLRWAVRHCPQAGYVLKADDDTFVNLPLLTTFLLERGRPNSAYGHVYFTSRVVRKGRWAVSNTDYPLENYPPYLSGTAYALSLDAARKIVEASDRMPLIPIEDAYVTGVLAVVAGVRRMSTKGFTYFAEHKADLCEFVLDARLVGNKMAAVDKYTLWNTLRIDDRRLCDAQSHIPRA
nr:hypothetical protein BaRGS_000208 [Batillaria attramentaria]